MRDFTHRVRDLENVLHTIKGWLELEDDKLDEAQKWRNIHQIVSKALEWGGIDQLREEARWYLRDFINYPINTRTGDDKFLQGLRFGSDSQWHVTPPPFATNPFEGEPVYTITHVPTGAEFKFNYHEISGDAST